MLYKVILTLEPMDEILKKYFKSTLKSVTFQIKATEQYFRVVLFIF